VLFEDTDLGLRLDKVPGYELKNIPHALTYHYHLRKLDGLLEKLHRAGRMDIEHMSHRFGADLDANPVSFGRFLSVLSKRPTARERLSRALLRLPVVPWLLTKIGNRASFGPLNNLIIGYLFAAALYDGYRNRSQRDPALP
jgi:hypothetical protein